MGLQRPYYGNAFSGARNVEDVARLRGVLNRWKIDDSAKVRVYDANSGEEFRIVTVYEDDGILCLDVERTDTLTTD